MSEIRIDPITGRHVIFAQDRDMRPSDLWNKEKKSTVQKDYSPDCPFCKGNEEYTPPATLEYPSKEDWQIRVVPNKYPAIGIYGAYNMEGIREQDPSSAEVKRIKSSAIFEKYSGIGIHEVIVESPSHRKNYFTMSQSEISDLIRIVHSRYLFILERDQIEFVSFFKNHQKLAGASLHHTHSQIIGLNMTPDFILYEVDGSKGFYEKTGYCPYCYIVEDEREKRVRIVYENSAFVVLCPFAPKYKYETWIIPKRHQWDFAQEQNLEELAEAIKYTFQALYRQLGDFPFNFYLHALPVNVQEAKKYYHYHFEINPRLSGNAGFELGTGIFINTVFPEEAAANLRKQIEQINIEQGDKNTHGQ